MSGLIVADIAPYMLGREPTGEILILALVIAAIAGGVMLVRRRRKAPPRD